MTLLIGIVSYITGVSSIALFALFLFGVPETISIDRPTTNSLIPSLLVNLGLIVIFGLQHSLMARACFKEKLRHFIPESLERSTYVFASALALTLLVLCWQPIPIEIWVIRSDVAQSLIFALHLAGWAFALWSISVQSHLDLFGLKQVTARGDYQPLPFSTPGPYRWVRHPLYLGLILAFWSTPSMTVGHLVLSLGLTSYIFVALIFEERDLVTAYGKKYQDYQMSTPKVFPRLKKLSQFS